MAEVSNFCNHEELNNVNSYFVNSGIVEVSSYNLVMSVNAVPKVSIEHDQQTDQVQTDLENSITSMQPVPSLLFEASDRFFGVVYNYVMQETYCSSSTSCINVSTLEGTKNAQVQNVGTSKSSNFKNATFQNV